MRAEQTARDPKVGGTLATPTAWRRQLARRLALLDAIAISAASVLAYWIRASLGESGVMREFANELPSTLAVLPLWLLIMYAAGAYRPEYLNSGGDAFRRFTAGTVGGVFALGFLSFLLNLQLSRLFVLILFLAVWTLGGFVRIWLRRYLASRHHRGELTQNVLIVGADTEGHELARAISRSERTGYRVVGFLDDSPAHVTPETDLSTLGSPRDVLELAQEHNVGLVIVSPSSLPPGTLQDVALSLEGTPIDLAVAPSLFQVMTRRMTVESVANVPILHVDQIRLERGKATLKRGLDLLAAGLVAVATVPLVIISAIAIKLEDRGPILFQQARVGKGGRDFVLIKLRTMVPDAESQLPDLAPLNEAGDKFFKVRDDPRVTRVGRHLRRWSLDELPQLWNVLRGDMSMVGPRPPLPGEVAEYTEWEKRRLRVRPGITGVWQTSGRSNVPFDEAIRLDLFYIENWSLGYDLFLLAKTASAIIRRDGAY